jgi:hypothetical protein
MAMVSEMPPTWSPLVIFIDIANIPSDHPYMGRGFGLLWEWLFTRDNYIDQIIIVPIYSFNVQDSENERLLRYSRQALERFRQLLITEMQAGMMQNIIAESIVDEGPPVSVFDPTYFSINYCQNPVKYLMPDLFIVGEKLDKLKEYFGRSTRLRWDHSNLITIQYYDSGSTSGRYLQGTEGLTSLEDLFG